MPAGGARSNAVLPNLVVIITDDLGYGEVGCYGQKRIRTPNIDALAAQGVLFTDAYSGSPVCAPSRCCLLTGLHTGHSAIRDNKELQPEGQLPLPESSITVAQVLKSRGYATAAIGKWGLGPPGSSGDPGRHGFDSFFGYLCQRHAHNHCPPYIYRNNERIELPGNKAKYESGVIGPGIAEVYAPDLFLKEATEFVGAAREGPYFLLFATPVPHLALQVPEASIVEYRGTMEEKPYDGKRGYLAHPEPHAAYAGMVTRMDADVGAILARVREASTKAGRDTLVIFTSDNGPTIDVGGADSGFFESTAGLRGRKMDLYEGGIRVPFIAAWVRTDGTGDAASRSSEPIASWDVFPTLASIAGAAGEVPAGLDGVDLSPLLTGQGEAPSREYLYWEYPSGKGWQAVRMGQWKGVRRNAKGNPDGPIELYDLSSDPGETRDVASQHPEIVERMRAIMASRTASAVAEWNY